MTKREIQKKLSGYTGFVASRIKVENVFDEYNFRACDVDFIDFDYYNHEIVFHFKKYFKNYQKLSFGTSEISYFYCFKR